MYLSVSLDTLAKITFYSFNSLMNYREFIQIIYFY